MLVLSRGATESVVIGEEIEIVVLSIKGGRARLGIRAPREIPVRRAEIEARDTRGKEGKTDRRAVA